MISTVFHLIKQFENALLAMLSFFTKNFITKKCNHYYYYYGHYITTKE